MPAAAVAAAAAVSPGGDAVGLAERGSGGGGGGNDRGGFTERRQEVSAHFREDACRDQAEHAGAGHDQQGQAQGGAQPQDEKGLLEQPDEQGVSSPRAGTCLRAQQVAQVARELLDPLV